MDRHLRPLLPATSSPSSSQGSSSQSNNNLVPRPKASLAACEECRKRKVKCDGQRPTCSRCGHIDIACVYRAAQGETPVVALKRKHGALQVDYDQLRELFDMIHGRDHREAKEIFDRIRTTDDPNSVLLTVKQADLLLPERLPDTNHHPDVEKLDAEALQDASIRVPARPWTTVAGDGVVSELITDFFQNDHGYLAPMIHADFFLQDMRAQRVEEATHCSPTLVNAICALKGMSSPRARKLGSVLKLNMTDLFLRESKRLLELELGRRSVTTIQALSLMYLTSALLGQDRAGQIHRFLAHEMMRRLPLEAQYARLAPGDLHKEELSRVIWGVFCFENRMSYFYSEPSLMQIPILPITVEDSPELAASSFGGPLQQDVRVFDLMCQLSRLFKRIMAHNSMTVSIEGNAQDTGKRSELYLELRAWYSGLPSDLLVETRLTAQNCHLQFHASETAISILQLLPPDDFHIPGETLVVKQLILRHCETDSRVIEQYLKVLPADAMVGRALFVALNALAPYLVDSVTHGVFTRDSFLLRACLPACPLMKVFMKGVLGLVQGLGHEIPRAARDAFENLGGESTKDLPISYALPYYDTLREVLAGEEARDDGLGVELSTLINKIE